MGERGYLRRGVRGWARREEVEGGTGVDLPGLLPLLRDRGLLDEERVEVPGTRPVSLYRISGDGALRLAQQTGGEARVSEPRGLAHCDEDPAVYIPPGPFVALRLLRAELAEPRYSTLRGDDLVGWCTEGELWERLEPELDPELVAPPNWTPVSAGGLEASERRHTGFRRPLVAMTWTGWIARVSSSARW